MRQHADLRDAGMDRLHEHQLQFAYPLNLSERNLSISAPAQEFQDFSHSPTRIVIGAELPRRDYWPCGGISLL